MDNCTRVFHPKFIELFNNQKAPLLLVEDDKSTPYTLIFHTVFTEPGYNVAVARKNASIDAYIYIVETKNPKKRLATVFIKGAPGRDAMGVDFDVSFRVGEAYAVSGKAFGKYLIKQN